MLSLSQVYGIRTRSRAVEIFTTCAHMICTMEELEKVQKPSGHFQMPPCGQQRSADSSRPGGGDTGHWGIFSCVRLSFLWLEPCFSQGLALLLVTLVTLVPQSFTSISWPSWESKQQGPCDSEAVWGLVLQWLYRSRSEDPPGTGA